jgi:uncharacterized protein (TIGR00369 family)
MNAWAAGSFVELMGIRIIEVERGRVTAEMEVRSELMAPNGYLHAGSVIALADTAAGFGCRVTLPDGATGFTTIELKSNFLGTAIKGILDCEATMAHGGRTTQVWDAVVRERASGKTLALFRCTQLVLYPRQEKQVEASR